MADSVEKGVEKAGGFLIGILKVTGTVIAGVAIYNMFLPNTIKRLHDKLFPNSK